MDVLWPTSSDGVWRALLQTNPANNDDGDWFVKNVASGGIGISQYFGSLQPGVWYRIAMVVNAQATGGTLQFYINGVNVGTINSAGSRFALASQLLVFADNNSETAAGYVSAMMLSDRSWSATELAALGGPSAVMVLPSTSALQSQARTNADNVIVEQPPATRKYNGQEKRKGEFDNKGDKLRSQTTDSTGEPLK
jgi:hypothetical protein